MNHSVTIIIPNYNGKDVLSACLSSLQKQTHKDFDVIIVDNGSEDGSVEMVDAFTKSLSITTICHDENLGFAKAVNEGIRAASSEYVLLLNNDTIAGHHMVEELVQTMNRNPKAFSAQALMLQMQDRDRVDNAGDYMTILGWARTHKKGELAKHIRATEKTIFSACAGAAIYRRSLVISLGAFDESYFAYLEDVDLGYRANLQGYRNLLAPQAKVLHMGSATSGSRYNAFKVQLAARNALITCYKNMPDWQWALNFLPIMLGCFIKWLFFCQKNLGKAYARGVWEACKRMQKIQKTDFSDVPSERLTNIQKCLFSDIFK